MERPEMKEVLVSLHMLRRSLRSGKAQEKIGQHQSSGTQAITQKVDNHGSSIPRSSSNSSVTNKFSILDIFNRKSRMFESYGGSILEAVGIPMFTLKELKRITRSYSHCISEDHTGFVYKGCIENQDVAVKRLACWDITFETEGFVDAMSFALIVRHKNIISLVGCCLEREPPLLVYEFPLGKSLHELLHCYNGTLSLDLRLHIAIGSAEALAYLCSFQKFHGNVTSTCIVLDHDLLPKVDIFCAYLISHSIVYFKTGCLTSKTDVVYSFGIVLLELITRKQPRHSLRFESIRAFNDEDGSWKAMVDAEIIVVEGNLLILEEMGKLAVQCCSVYTDERPEMVEVVRRLENLRYRLQDATALSCANISL